MKAILAVLIGILRTTLNMFFSNSFRRTEEYLSKNPETDINTEFVNEYLSVLEWGTYASQATLIILVCLSFKWRKLADYFFMCEILVSMWEAFHPFPNYDQMINERYTYLYMLYWAVTVMDLNRNMFISFFYICVFGYA